MDSDRPEQNRPMSVSMAAAWVATATLVFLSALIVANSLVPGFETNVVAGIACQVGAYAAVVVAIWFLHERGERPAV